MKKLLNLKQWLTVADAARHLSILFGEEVTEADVLRLALDERLMLSVHFVNHASGRRGSVVPLQDAKWRRTKKISGDGWFYSIDGLDVGQERVIEWDPGITELEGIWDLTMLGSERLDVEHRYQALTGGPAVNLVFLDGPIVSRDDGTYCQIREHVSESEFVGPKNFSELPNNPRNYYPAAGLPADSVLVVRTSSLHELESRLSQPDQKAEKPLEQRERDTLLVIVAALAELAEIDVKKPAAAGTTIESQTALLGAEVSSRTIQNHLKRIPEALERRTK
jgi:hypothetical protein